MTQAHGHRPRAAAATHSTGAFFTCAAHGAERGLGHGLRHAVVVQQGLLARAAHFQDSKGDGSNEDVHSVQCTHQFIYICICCVACNILSMLPLVEAITLTFRIS